MTLVRRSVGLAEAGTKAEAAKPAPWGELPRGCGVRSSSNLLLAAAILSGGGGSGSAAGQETETDGSRSAGQSPSLTAAAALSPTDGLRGGSAARSPVCPEVGGQSEREKKAENKAVSGRSADGVTVAASASGEWSAFIPILPADVASLSGGRQAAGGQSVTCCCALLPEGLGPCGRCRWQPFLAATIAARNPVARIEVRSRLARSLPASVVRRRRKSPDFKLAERGGFEPPVPVDPVRRFSKPHTSSMFAGGKKYR